MTSDKYFSLHDYFYEKSRKYAEMEEMKGFGEAIASTAYCQCLLLISVYEFGGKYLPRSWITTGKAIRVALMLSFNRLDTRASAVEQRLQPPKDFTEREERRRTFWALFHMDRFASVATGWPMAIDERDVSGINMACCCPSWLDSASLTVVNR